MSRILSAAKLVASVRKRAMIPDDTSAYTDEDILDIVNEEMDIGMLPRLLSLNEEHLVTFVEVETEQGKSRYKIPYRAIGNKLRDVAYIDGAGSHYEMSRISLEELSDYRSSFSNYRHRDVFYVEGDEVVLVDSRNNDYEKLRFYIYLRPSVIVSEDEVGKIDSIDTVSGTITLSNFPSDFSSTPLMDFVGARTPNKTFAFDIQPTSVNATAKTVTFDPASLPSNLAAGDYLCLAEETPVPQIPTEMHPVLAQRAAIHILEALGDSEGLANAQRRLQDMDAATMSMIDDRVEGAPQKINQRASTLLNSLNGTMRKRRRL
jgi:hypothetical protein